MILTKITELVKKISLAIIVGAFVILSLGSPVLAGVSSPTKGEANLNDLQAKTDRIARKDPLNLTDIKENTGKGGLNEVQGTADKDKMISPEDAKNQTSIEEKIKEFIGGKD